jgi:AraC-like DNA-binding protein
MTNVIYPIIGIQTSLPFYLTGIGTCDPEYGIKRENGLFSHLFLFTSEGQGLLTVKGNSYIQKEGSMFYLAPGVPHEYWPNRSGWITNWIVFKGDSSNELLSKIGFSDFEYSADTNMLIYRNIFKRILSIAKEPLKGAEKSSILLYEFILTAADMLLCSTKEKYGMSSVIEPAIIHINEHYTDDITLENLAKISGVSLQHFCRVFKTKTGMRPMEYLAKKRISEAKILLINTGESIGYVSSAVGYGDQNYFGMVFKKYEGITPSDYRKQRGLIII